MNNHKVLIIDDEPISRRITKNFLSQIEGYEVIGEASSANEGFPLLLKHDIDLIFLDIEMPEINGLDFLRSIANPPKVIIISAYREYAIEGYDLNVVDYLLKPVALERFQLAIQKFEDAAPNRKQLKKYLDEFLFVRSDRKHYKIDFDQVVFIESKGDYLYIHQQDENIKTKETISRIEQKLPEQFIRIHRSYIVNMNHVKALNKEFVEIGDEMLPVSKSFRESICKIFE
ncbi:LytR/AlgR family response regulator transcription factor [Flammeovirga agarivorans]|uniref:Response regulator transcription factor n=1 Tax=Flammeovirga agarivorans TaxID=2726742 RepID=A0A7X8SPB4_9BACT|nr:LytTR family DNA-binding domain-containing protein [Flammeovirga agarivorans]NLR93915.1 response regulator transcription factor [Flammeovirga agarivorans]